MSRHGGRRPGAGRPKGSGQRFKEPTIVKRIPKSLVPEVDLLIDAAKVSVKESPPKAPLEHSNVVELYRVSPTAPKRERPLLVSSVPAGFPSPADDYVETYLDLNEYLIKQPAATYHVKVSGESMIGAGIMDGDLLVVDRSLAVTHNAIIVAILDGEPTVKRLKRERTGIQLWPENSEYPVIYVGEGQDFVVWGVVTGVVRKL